MQLSKGDLVDPLKALEMGQPGDVIVVDAGGDPNTSVCGGLMGGLAQNRGIRGMIVDGAGRDTDELEDIGWPIWTRAITPRGTHTMFSGRKDELSINVPIACGGVPVNPGDFIVADLMGVGGGGGGGGVGSGKLWDRCMNTTQHSSQRLSAEATAWIVSPSSHNNRHRFARGKKTGARGLRGSSGNGRSSGWG